MCGLHAAQKHCNIRDEDKNSVAHRKEYTNSAVENLYILVFEQLKIMYAN